MTTQRFWSFFAFLFAVTLPVLEAGAVTIEGHVRFWDERTSRGDSTSDHRLANVSVTNQPLPGAYVSVYDRNGTCVDFEPGCSEANDTLLQGIAANSSGFFTTSVASGKDIYLVSRYWGLWNGDELQVRIGTSTPIAYSYVTPNVTSTLHIDWNLSCWQETDGLCNGQAHVDNDWPVSRDISNLLASMLEVSRWAGPLSVNGHATIYGYYGVPYWNAAKCTGGSAGHAYGYDRFCVQTSLATSNWVTAHEIGHLVMKRRLNDGSGPLAPNPNYGGWTGWSEEKVAVSEGWADFYYAATYWYPYAGVPTMPPSNWAFEGHTSAGNSSLAKCVSYSVNPHRRGGNAARFFWDLFDSTTVGDNTQDNANYSLATISGTWDSFYSGTANRQASESDVDGRNARDFTAYMSLGISERDQNCLNGQDDG